MNAMKWQLLLAVAVIAAIPMKTNGQIVVPIGTIMTVAESGPTTWAMSGMEMVKISRTIGAETPIMRSLKWDARTVEILSRTQSPPLRSSDVKRLSKDGREMIVVRRFLLMEVMHQDAKEKGISKRELAQRWVKSIRAVLPQVAPAPSRFGI